MMNLTHFLNMGGYGIYVWPAYLFTLFIFAYQLVSTRLEKKRIQKSAKQFILLSQTKTNNVVTFAKKQEPQREIV